MSEPPNMQRYEVNVRVGAWRRFCALSRPTKVTAIAAITLLIASILIDGQYIWAGNRFFYAWMCLIPFSFSTGYNGEGRALRVMLALFALPASFVLLAIIAASGGAYVLMAAGMGTNALCSIALTRNLGVLLRAAISKQKPRRFKRLLAVTAICGYVVVVFLRNPNMLFFFPFSLIYFD